MPKETNKWEARGGRSAENKSYFRHDDRVERNSRGSHGDVRSRVLKTHRSNKKELMKLAMGLDKDIPMIGSNNNSRQDAFRGKNKNKWNRPNLRKFTDPKNSRSPLPLTEDNWYRVTIPYGHKYEKEYVLKTLLNYMTCEVFIPIMYKTTAKEAVFYIDNRKTADALLNCDRKISMDDGFKLQVRVNPGFPRCNIDDKFKERLKQAMAKRYNQESCALDMSRFYQESDLSAEYFCALFDPQLLMAVLSIMAECVPNLKALNLEGNKLRRFDKLSILSKKFPQLKILHINDNQMRNIHQLDTLKDLKLDELKLVGNPCCNKYKTRTDEYISDVRKRFPKLLRLDGMELPRPIVFDVIDENTNKIPPTQRMFVGDEQAKEIASQFLQQYFAILDSDQRQSLLNAYTEHAMFSMTITYSHSNKLQDYLSENRNLFKINDTTKRQKLLKQGRLSIVSFITEMPRTKHLLDTFTMDITAMETMMFITITGYFQEISTKNQPIRYFNRTFIIVPENGGYCIRNEQLHISQPPEMQIRHVLQQLTQQMNQQSSQQSQPAQSSEMIIEMVPEVSDTHVTNVEEIKKQMVVNLSQQTNMNLNWSLKCLEETHWNYDNAISAFQKFFELGQIPSVAFAK